MFYFAFLWDFMFRMFPFFVMKIWPNNYVIDEFVEENVFI